MAVTRQSIRGVMACFVFLVCASAFAQTVSDHELLIGGWRLPEVIIILGVGLDIGITLTRLSVVEKKADDLVRWRVEEHPRDVNALREAYDAKISRLHERINDISQR